jgi:hypothetical protein
MLLLAVAMLARGGNIRPALFLPNYAGYYPSLHLRNRLDAVEKRPRPWWVSTGAPIARSRVKGMQTQLEKLGVPRLAGEVAAFLEVRKFPRDVYMHLIPSPEFDGAGASASPNAHHFYAEIIHSADHGAAAWEAVHELTHSFYDAAPEARKLALMQEFAASPDPAAQPLVHE